MSRVHRAIGAVLIALVAFATLLIFEKTQVSDPDLRYPIVLLTELAGAIVILLFLARIGIVFVKEKILAVAPGTEEGLRNFSAVLLVTGFSLIACVFGVSLMRPKSGAIEYWPVPIVLVFGGLAGYGTRYLWRVWQVYRRLNRKR